MNNASHEISVSDQINAIIGKLTDWRGERLAQIRGLIIEADPDVIEEVKWKKPTNPDGIPVWSHNGIICTSEIYKKHIRLTFAKGASINDPQGLFTAYRAIIIREEDKINEAAFKDIIVAAVELNAKAKKTFNTPQK